MALVSDAAHAPHDDADRAVFADLEEFLRVVKVMVAKGRRAVSAQHDTFRADVAPSDSHSPPPPPTSAGERRAPSSGRRHIRIPPNSRETHSSLNANGSHPRSIISHRATDLPRAGQITFSYCDDESLGPNRGQAGSQPRPLSDVPRIWRRLGYAALGLGRRAGRYDATKEGGRLLGRHVADSRPRRERRVFVTSYFLAPRAIQSARRCRTTPR